MITPTGIFLLAFPFIALYFLLRYVVLVIIKKKPFRISKLVIYLTIFLVTIALVFFAFGLIIASSVTT